jgi:hypothetical protein
MLKLDLRTAFQHHFHDLPEIHAEVLKSILDCDPTSTSLVRMSGQDR